MNKITPEIQSLIDAEVSKREIQLESEYKNNFNKLKTELYGTLKEYANESIKKSVQLESVDKQCDELHYKPLVQGIVDLFNNNGIRLPMHESSSVDSETQSLLLEAVKTIQELRDMLAIHEMIENSLNGMSRSIIENALGRFKNDDRFKKMKKDDFLKEVANYVMSIKNGGPSRSVQFESIDIDKELAEVDSLLESNSVKPKDAYTDKFAPKGKIQIESLRKRVSDSAYALTTESKEYDPEQDPAREFIEEWG